MLGTRSAADSDDSDGDRQPRCDPRCRQSDGRSLEHGEERDQQEPAVPASQKVPDGPFGPGGRPRAQTRSLVAMEMTEPEAAAATSATAVPGASRRGAPTLR